MIQSLNQNNILCSFHSTLLHKAFLTSVGSQMNDITMMTFHLPINTRQDEYSVCERMLHVLQQCYKC